MKCILALLFKDELASVFDVFHGGRQYVLCVGIGSTATCAFTACATVRLKIANTVEIDVPPGRDATGRFASALSSTSSIQLPVGNEQNLRGSYTYYSYSFRCIPVFIVMIHTDEFQCAGFMYSIITLSKTRYRISDDQDSTSAT